MKNILPFSCLFAAGVLLTACHSNTMMMSPMSTAPTNGQLVKDVMVANQGEIATSKVAMRRAVNPNVRHYANYIHSQHVAGLHKIMTMSHKAGIKTEDSTLSKDLQKHNADELKMLRSSTRQDFDKNYVNAAVEDHQDALRFLDRAIKESTNPKLTQELQKARHYVAIHLEKAKQLQQQIVRQH